jgi:hypothetical protein
VYLQRRRRTPRAATPQNVGPKPLDDLAVSVLHDPRLYFLPRPLVSLPQLLPGVVFRLDLDVDSVDEGGAADALSVLLVPFAPVYRGGSAIVGAQPTLVTTVQMPVSQPRME